MLRTFGRFDVRGGGLFCTGLRMGVLVRAPTSSDYKAPQRFHSGHVWLVLDVVGGRIVDLHVV